MLSSAWHSLTGTKRSRNEEKKEADEHKSNDLPPLTAPPLSAPTTLAPAPTRGTRKRSKTEQQLRSVPTSTIAVTPSSASTLSYVAPPLVAPDAALASQSAHPDQPPPSYEDSKLHEPIVFIDGQPQGQHSNIEQKWPQSDSGVEEQKFPASSQPPHISQPVYFSQSAAQSPLPVAAPLMADQPEPLTQRLTRSATAAILALRAHPTYQAGQAKAVALAGKHLSPEVVDYIQAPSLGKVLRHPTMLFVVYRLFASVRAPFVGLFRGILVNAAKRALWKRKVKSKDMAANADTTNAAINDGLKQAIGRDMNVQLSPEVCKQIVDNIDMKELKKIFDWFATEPVVPVVVAGAKK